MLSRRKPNDVRRVLLVTPGGMRARGGIGRLVEYVVDGWNHPALELSVADTYGPGPKAAMPFYFAASLLSLLGRALAGRVDVLHINMAERLSVARKGVFVHLGRALGIPVVLHLHGAEFAEYCRALSPARFRRLVAMMRKADRLVVLGDYWREFVTVELGLPPERVQVLHNAVAGPVELPVRPPHRPCRLLFMGAVSPRKGVDVLLQAAARLDRDAGWSLTVAGNGDVESFRAQAQRVGLTDRVQFLGWVDAARGRELFAASDVLVLPSRNEGLPMAILEAMSFGLPVVTTPVGSIRDAVTDGENGYLVPVGDHRALAEALRALIADPQLRDRLGGASRRRYEERFCLPAFNARLADIFRAVLVESRPAAPSRLVTGGG